MSAPIRVLIADDHDVVRDGLRMILESEAGFEVSGEAVDGQQAVEQFENLRPDVVLMDLRMPRLDGIQAIERIREIDPQAAIVILTTYDEDELMLRGLRAGARGFLLKDTNRQILFESLRAAARGAALLQPEVIARVLTAAPKSRKPRSQTPEGTLSPTARELEVLRRIATGERNKEVAAALGITERTVKAHLTNVYNKLGVDSRAAAVAEAARRGWLDETH